MRPPQTLAERLVFLAGATAIFGLGVLFFLQPPEPIPEDPDSYRRHEGLLEEVLARESGRRHALIRFRIIKDPAVYESRAARIDELSGQWANRRTTLVFYTVPDAKEPGTPGRPRTVYGLAADGRVTRTLESDILHTNALVSPWPGVLALGIGSFCYLVAGLAWWRRRAA